MKTYEPENLVAVSRCRNCFLSLPAEIQEDIYARIVR